jgi:hypothetical protein
LGHGWVIVAGQMTQAKSKALQAFWAGLGHLVIYLSNSKEVIMVINSNVIKCHDCSGANCESVTK